MHIERVQLKNFLSHSDVDISLCPGINVIYGQNAVGKTNLLDSMYLSAVGRSYKYSKDKDLIAWDSKEEATVIVDVKNRFTSNQVKIQIGLDGKKRIFINDFRIMRIGELMGTVNLIMFHPDELKLIKDSPSERRRFMDISICQKSKKYFYALVRYDKLLNQRNAVLKKYKGMPLLKTFLDITTKEIVKTAETIMRARKDFVENMLVYAKEQHKLITQGEEILDLVYEREMVDFNDFENSYTDLLNRSLEKDENLGYTSVGPHRDDIKITSNNVDIRKFGSQGQQRSAVLSLKLAEIKLYEEFLGEKPILLLDDVLAELDVNRCNAFCSAIQGIQTIVASTDIPINLEGGRIFHIGKDKKVVQER
ncbi:MAG TPA: DNA replication/repair protein RecF [Clostridiales bacterium]|nr:DNA replication/repair protein RecF [Clostridiales bacterium]